jgi:hypothetical protein
MRDLWLFPASLAPPHKGLDDPAPAAACSITRDNLGPYKTKVLVIPAVYFLASLVRS